MFLPAFMAWVYSVPLGQTPQSAAAIAVDSDGNSYIAGDAGQTQTASSVTKLDSVTGRVVWSTVLRGTQITTIAVNGAGEVYAGGMATTAFGAAENGVGFLAKLSADGSKVILSAFLGHARTTVTALTLDAAGRICLTGDTNDRGFPTTAGAFQPKAPVTVYQGNIFVTRLTPDASAASFSTMIDGSLEEHTRGIALDSAGNVYVTGYTYSRDFPVTQGAYRTQLDVSGLSGFVAKVDSSGSTLRYSTLLPAGISVGIGVDGGGNAVVASSEGVVRKLNPGGTGVLWQATVTGTSGDKLNALALDVSGNTYLTGTTKSANLPVRDPSQACHFAGSAAGSSDAFLTTLDSRGNITSGTYVNDTAGVRIATDAIGAAYLAGSTSVMKFDLTRNPSQPLQLACWAHGATFTAGPVAPGELVSLFGSGLGPDEPASLKLDSNGRVSNSLAGTQVLFDGLPAPLLYAQSAQINAVAPWELGGKTTTEICVVHSGARTNCLTSQVRAMSFGFFNGVDGNPVVVNPDGAINSADHPAAIGDTILLFATGAGVTTPLQLDGEVTAFAMPQATPLTVKFNNGFTVIVNLFSWTYQELYANAMVGYFGPAPSLVAGISQINVQVPPLTVNGRLPVYFSIAPTQQAAAIVWVR